MIYYREWKPCVANEGRGQADQSYRHDLIGTVQWSNVLRLKNTNVIRVTYGGGFQPLPPRLEASFWELDQDIYIQDSTVIREGISLRVHLNLKGL